MSHRSRLTAGLVLMMLAAWLSLATAPTFAQDPPPPPPPPGEPLSEADTTKLCTALDKLKCAVENMKADNPDKEKADKGYKAAKAAKEKKKKKADGTEEADPRFRKGKTKPGVWAHTTPEKSDDKSVSGTSAVGEGGEYVVINEDEMANASPEELAGLLGHEGMRLQQDYSYPRTGQSKKDKQGITGRAVEAWCVHVAVLKSLKEKEKKAAEEAQAEGNEEAQAEHEAKEKKLCDRLETAEKAKKYWQDQQAAVNALPDDRRRAALIRAVPVPVPIVPRAGRILYNLGFKAARVAANGELFDALDGATALTGASAPGDFQRLADDSFLVAGQGGNGGTLEHWVRVGPQTLVLASSYTLPGSDFTGVAWDPNSNWLHLLDATSRAVWRASWNGASSLPVVGWQRYATSLEVPALTQALDYQLDIVWPDDADPSVDPGHLYVGLIADWNVDGTAISGPPGALTTATWSWFDHSLTPDFLIDWGTLADGNANVTVRHASAVPAPVSFEVVHVETDTVLGSATFAPGTSAVSLVLSQPAVLGDSYVARPSGDATNPPWASRTLRRHGTPQGFANGITLDRIAHPLDVRIGNPELSLGVSITAPTSLAGTKLSGILLLGLAGPGGDPVVPWNGTLLLSPALVTLPATGSVDLAGDGMFSATFALPNDPNLVGVPLFYQFALIDSGGAIALSEVVAVEIDAP